jgi:hypothetical protein
MIMAIVKKDHSSSSAFISFEDIDYLTKEAKKERWGLLPTKIHSSPGDDEDCVGCPIWIRWACIKCGVCMYWLQEE